MNLQCWVPVSIGTSSYSKRFKNKPRQLSEPLKATCTPVRAASPVQRHAVSPDFNLNGHRKHACSFLSVYSNLYRFEVLALKDSPLRGSHPVVTHTWLTTSIVNRVKSRYTGTSRYRVANSGASWSVTTAHRRLHTGISSQVNRQLVCCNRTSAWRRPNRFRMSVR